MNILNEEKAISEIQHYLGIQLRQVPSKRIFYKGTLPNGGEVLVCTPYSKMYPKGNAWVDITIKQKEFLQEAAIPFFAFRLANGKIYYLNFRDLEPFLTTAAILNNEREGDHWKLHIYPDLIKVLGHDKTLPISPNQIKNLHKD